MSTPLKSMKRGGYDPLVDDPSPTTVPFYKTKIFFAITGGLFLVIIAIIVIVVVTRGGEPNFDGLKDFCADVSPIQPAEFIERQQKVQQILTDNNWDALIMESGATQRYFTGARWGVSERPFMFVIPRAGDVSFISPRFELGTARERVGNDVAIYTWQEDESPYELVNMSLGTLPRENGLRVAVDWQMRQFVSDGIRGALEASAPGSVVENGFEVVRAARIVKSGAEIELMRCVNRATKAAIAAVAPHIKEGMVEDDVKKMLVDAQSTAGLSAIWTLVLFGPNAAYPHGTDATAAPLAKGDLILIDTGGSLREYQSDISRTFPFGDSAGLSDDQRRAWNTVKAAQDAALAIIAPGTVCADADAAARGVVADAGYGSGYEHFTHRLGHGIGLEGHEWPYLVNGNNLILEAGMMFSVEPGIYIPGLLGVRLEDIVMVTESGYEVFGDLQTSIDFE